MHAQEERVLGNDSLSMASHHVAVFDVGTPELLRYLAEKDQVFFEDVPNLIDLPI
ncbi:hypothetical protein GCM10010954_04720 [Halobacillus andaensis]|uniref:Uncharacterized protein n=1 Tax=Halobacillus andaensis TaxID=1176239 RepID=A0A917B0J2_HALAA|nr:hypothetical protein GCM10010954_04720 [Halobacillus andaensis]